MSLYWDVAAAEVSEAPPEPKHAGDSVDGGDEAYRLHVYYRLCTTAPRTPEQADRHLSRALDRTVDASAGQLEDWDELAEWALDRYTMCAPIPPDVDRQREAFLWLSAAVRLGHEVAQVQYYSAALEILLYRRPFASSTYLVLHHPELIDEFKVTARFALEEAIKNRHPEAYLAMAQAVLDGVIRPRDPAASLAWIRAAELGGPHDFLMDDMVARRKEAVAQHLDREQLLAAEKEALRIIGMGTP